MATTEISPFPRAEAQDWIMEAKRLVHGLASQRITDELEARLMEALTALSAAFELLDDGRG